MQAAESRSVTHSFSKKGHRDFPDDPGMKTVVVEPEPGEPSSSSRGQVPDLLAELVLLCKDGGEVLEALGAARRVAQAQEVS